ncbi:MAG: ATP-grasp domain-containing protein, partial [Fusobacteriaceae bacterium]
MIIEKGNIIGIIGGGQLAKMLIDSAKEMGYRTAVLDPSPDSCAGKIADIHIKGEYDDGKSLRLMAEISDVITYEFENIPATSLEVLKYFKAYIPQGARPLHLSQHRLREKDSVSKLGIKTAKYLPVKNIQELSSALEIIGYPAILKTASGGYDGKNQWILRDIEDFKNIKLKKQEYILEELVTFVKEVSCIIVRNLDDEIVTFPIGENFHEKGILKTTKVPADISCDIYQK